MGLVHGLRGVAIGLVLEAAAEQVEQGSEPKRHEAAQEREEEQSGNDAAGLETEGAIKPGCFGQLRDNKEGEEKAGGGKEEHFRNVSAFVMADLMSQDRFEFGFGKLGDEGVEQDDFPEASKAGEESVRMFRAFAAVHDLDGGGFEPGALAE